MHPICAFKHHASPPMLVALTVINSAHIPKLNASLLDGTVRGA
jgi:hypothetical protein